jgi:mannose-6-phosphate isomerase-like protein (cupin superfamily)
MSATTEAYADIVSTSTQDKPWGHEVIFASGEHDYVGKVLTVLAGQSLSLQYHDFKDETLRLVSGEALLEHGPSADALREQVMQVGVTVHLPPKCVHRITGISDAVFIEVSTAQPGWREDVVRLDDRYGRTGTSAP